MWFSPFLIFYGLLLIPYSININWNDMDDTNRVSCFCLKEKIHTFAYLFNSMLVCYMYIISRNWCSSRSSTLAPYLIFELLKSVVLFSFPRHYTHIISRKYLRGQNLLYTGNPTFERLQVNEIFNFACASVH